MNEDMKGRRIRVGDHVSDGLAAGTVTAVHDEQVWFTWEYGDGANNHRLFNRPGNLVIIPDERWRMVVGL